MARTVRRSKELCPELLIETLVGDFAGVAADVRTVVAEGRPDVFAHNVEVVPRLQRTMRDGRCSWERSVDVLRWAREFGAQVTKSSLMVGCGESEEEVLDAMQRLREAEVDVLTIGQYLRPSEKHAPLVRYVEPGGVRPLPRSRDADGLQARRFGAAGALQLSRRRGVLEGHLAPDAPTRSGPEGSVLASPIATAKSREGSRW